MDTKRAGCSGYEDSQYSRSIRLLDRGKVPGDSGYEFHVAHCRRRSVAAAEAVGKAIFAGADAVGGLREEYGHHAVVACGHSDRAQPGAGDGDEIGFLAPVQVPERPRPASAHAGCVDSIAE